MNRSQYLAAFHPREARRQARDMAQAIYKAEADKLGITPEEYCANMAEAKRLGLTVAELIARRRPTNSPDSTTTSTTTP